MNTDSKRFYYRIFIIGFTEQRRELITIRLHVQCRLILVCAVGRTRFIFCMWIGHYKGTHSVIFFPPDATFCAMHYGLLEKKVNQTNLQALKESVHPTSLNIFTSLLTNITPIVTARAPTISSNPNISIAWVAFHQPENK